MNKYLRLIPLPYYDPDTTATNCWVKKIKLRCVRFEVFTAVTMKNAVFWDVTPCTHVRTDVSMEPSASVIKATRISELGTLAVNQQPKHAAKGHLLYEKGSSRMEYKRDEWRKGDLFEYSLHSPNPRPLPPSLFISF
jgi:hypothetical protein